jgi:Domain of Unknown Function (DUF928)
MLNIKYRPHKLIECLSFVLVLNVIWLGLTHSATAEQQSNQTKSTDFGLPTHRRDGGSRGVQDSCVANTANQNLMALIPEKTVGINASASPKLFFYVPKIKETSTLEFVLRNQKDQLIYEAFLSTEGNGIMSVEVPGEVNSSLLKADQKYHWYLSMICNNHQRSRDIVAEGWMHQKALDQNLQEKLNNASSLEKVAIYREQGIWFDALSVLAENLDSVTENTMLRQQWSEMLGSVGLENLASESLIETKLVENPANAL